MPLGVGHQAEDPAGRVADARHGARASRWGWRGSPGSAGRRRRRSGARPGRPLRARPELDGSARRNFPSPWATGSSIGSRRSGTGEARRRGRAGPSAARSGPSRCGSASRRERPARRAAARPGPGPGSRCRCPGSGRRGRGTGAGRRRGPCRAAWRRSARRPGRRRRRTRRGWSGSGTRRARRAPRAAGRCARSRTAAPASSQAAAVSSSQLVPGARRTITRGWHGGHGRSTSITWDRIPGLSSIVL